MRARERARAARFIRRSAMREAPNDVYSLGAWLGPSIPNGVWDCAAQFCRHDDPTKNYLHGANETRARTFLLLVAEALS